MNTAWTVTQALKLALQKVHHWLVPVPAPLPSYAAAATRRHTATVVTVRSRPLRVVRVAEAGLTRTQTGRLVISGRMADVCAELDRLAACEAA